MAKQRIGGKVVNVGWIDNLNHVVLNPNRGANEPRILARLMAIDDLEKRKEIWANMTEAEADELRTSMNQSGDEMGKLHVGSWDKLYAGTSKSFNINQALRTDMKDLHHPMSDWDKKGYTMDDARKAINQIDRGMKPLTKEIKTIRYDESQYVLSDFGVNENIAQLASLSADELNEYFTGRTRIGKTYMSTSYKESANVFKSRDVITEFTLGAGVNAVVTNNRAESEITVGRGYDQRVTGARIENVGGSRKLVLRVEITKENRSGYFKV